MLTAVVRRPCPNRGSLRVDGGANTLGTTAEMTAWRATRQPPPANGGSSRQENRAVRQGRGGSSPTWLAGWVGCHVRQRELVSTPDGLQSLQIVSAAL